MKSYYPRIPLWGAFRALVVAAPVSLAAVLSVLITAPYADERRLHRFLELAKMSDPERVDRLFSNRGASWPPEESVPALSVRSFPSGLETLAVDDKKSLFFRALLPVVLVENERIRREREIVERAFSGRLLVPGDGFYATVSALATRYQVEGDLNDTQVREKLLRRIDTLPPGLVLAQAANESAWGTSRFAREGNNLFGHWTWDADEGMLPRERAAGASHYVRVFSDIRSSVRAYLHNINVGRAYEKLRETRAAMRGVGKPLDPLVLAGGLTKYSQRGLAYVNDIRTLIRSNGLDRLNAPRLADR